MPIKGVATIFLLICVVCLTRIPFVTDSLCEHDSVNFALALEKFDIQNHQPHPPGYILYIGMAKFINLFEKDINKSLIIVSIFFSCLSVVLIYLLGKTIFNYRCGLISALFLISSPLFWAYGELALSYTADALAFLLAGYIGYQVLVNKKQWVSLLSITVGFAAGLRQSSLFFLFPLWITVLISLKSWKQTCLREIIKQIVLLGFVCLAWFIPLIILSGGLAQYRIASQELYKSSVLPQLKSFKTPFYASFSVLWGLGGCIIGLFLVIYRVMRMKMLTKKLLSGESVIWFIVCWGPIVLFYFIIYIGKAGYILGFLPCLILLSSLFVHKQYGLIERVFSLSIILLNLLMFLYVKPLSGEERLFGIKTAKFKDFTNFWMLEHSNKGLREKEKFKNTLEIIKQNFSPDTTIIITQGASPRITKYYLRNFTVAKSSFIGTDLPSQIKTIIWLSDKGFQTEVMYKEN